MEMKRIVSTTMKTAWSRRSRAAEQNVKYLCMERVFQDVMICIINHLLIKDAFDPPLKFFSFFLLKNFDIVYLRYLFFFFTRMHQIDA